jgi:mutual gliding-motility protein MglA
MSLVNYGTKEITYKLVYYGPGLGGKTTNLKYIHSQLDSTSRGNLVSLATETERTLFFDFMPLDLGKVKDFTVKMGVYTVPGQIEYNRSRQLILDDVDGIIFVADSAANRLEDNVASLLNMIENLAQYQVKLDELPWLIQYNKRDLDDALPLYQLEQAVNIHKVPSFEAVALDGRGVFATLKALTGLVVKQQTFTK